MKESEFQSQFNRWIKADMARAAMTFGESAAMELKVCRNRTFNLNDIRENQHQALQDVLGSGRYVRIVDQPYIEGRGFQQKKPFDCLILNGEAWVVIFFYVKGQRLKDRECVAVRYWDLIGAESRRIGHLKKIGVTFNPWNL